ncbi:SDR family NAD(P)-dependent oxidoreductase [Williamsia phyllosphaerae]|uniref:Short-chain dehydrogenase n=1 Tax=Williamsia phyllosphaerae TaxID=885042 RepID=A0ABQ1V612_9NOCA|nr:SDR family NAD(P)-dependent oxidoreductase [Williamsia phyllosphaerae]GGF40625.1 short-chain dehydrogenase [Williamsia phyllosphaerae]
MSEKKIDLSGAVVVITGAAGGIGRAVARELHARGGIVVLVDLDQASVDAVAGELGPARTLALRADVTSPDDLRHVMDTAAARFGRIDVVHANAGISSGESADTVLSVADGTFERVIAVNLAGVWNTVRAALPHIVESQGHVLITSSTYAYLNGMVNAPYAATKAAVEQIGRALRVELAAHGASAGVLYPGWVATPIADVAFGKDDLATALVARAFPAPLRTPIAPERVGRAVAAGIERRAARVQIPRRWIPVATLRGIINPLLDRSLRRDTTLIDLVRQVETRSGRRLR